MKIKITQPGWHAYNGELSGVMFEAGVSLDHISPRDAYALGSYVSVVELNEDGTEGNPVNPAWDMARNQVVTAAVRAPMARLSDILAAEADKKAAEGAAPASPVRKTHTKAELEAIAAEKGIAGIREVAAPLGLKGVAVRTLIEEILLRQNSTTAR